MPPLRPPLFPRIGRYVCPSCTAKIQARSIAPWLARGAASKASGGKKVERNEGPRTSHKRKNQNIIEPGSITFNEFDEAEDGTLVPSADSSSGGIENIEADYHSLLAEAQRLEDQILGDNDAPVEKNPFPDMPSFEDIADGKFDLMDDLKDGEDIDEEFARNATVLNRRPPYGRAATESEMESLNNEINGLKKDLDDDSDSELDTVKTLLESMEMSRKHRQEALSKEENEPESLEEMLMQQMEKEDPVFQKLKGRRTKEDEDEGDDLIEEELHEIFSKGPAKTKDGKTLDLFGLLSSINATSASADATAIPLGSFPDDSQINIMRLNVALEKCAKKDTDEDIPKELWKWYSLSRKSLALHWDLVPEDVWAILWHYFSVDSSINPDRFAHLHRLGDDMKAAGLKLSKRQVLLHLEATFLQGYQAEAINQWRSCRSSLIFDTARASEYWALGARMLANNRQPDEAQQAAEILLNDRNFTKDYRILLPIMNSWLTSKDNLSVQKAWALYIRFKFLMGAEATMEDYDAVIGGFLDSKHTDLALAVFRDMMMTGDESAYHHDSVALYKRYHQTLGNLHSINFWPEELSWKSHEPFTILLPKQRNKFFFGSWIKKLIGDGRPDSAAQVLEVMYERGIPPDPKYLNGIIGAWFRSGDKVSQQKGEEMAWRMIGDRLSYVKVRSERVHNQLSGPVRPVYGRNKSDYQLLPGHRISVNATSETFSVLIAYYQQRQKHERAQDLLDMIGAAQISPSTSFLNDMLVIGVRNHGAQWAWATYEQMLKQRVKPDIITFGLLWRLMRDHINPVKNRARVGFPSCRVLFAETVRWQESIKQDGISPEVYLYIVRCFGLADDQIGTAVAIRALQEVFNVYPDKEIVRSIALQLTSVSVTGSGPPRRRLNSNKRDGRKKLAEIARIMSSLKEDRDRALVERGIDVAEMSDEEKAGETVSLLCDILKYAAQNRPKKHIEASWQADGQLSGSVVRMGQAAAQEMGVEHCAPFGIV